jgi:hypothetical protein
MAPERTVPLYGRDRTLSNLRGKILELSGFVAKTTDVPKEALELIHGGAFDLLIWCQTLLARERLEALEAANAQPAMKRLLLSHRTRHLPRSMIDGECNPSEGPECQIEQAATLLKVAPRFPASKRKPRS